MKKYIPGILVLGVFFSLTLSSCSDNGTGNATSGKSYQKVISSFNFDEVPSLNFDTKSVSGVVSEEHRTVTLNVNFGVDVTALIPTIVISDKATISPASGVAQNFGTPVTYTITAEDGTSKVYVVTVTVSTSIDFSVYAPSQVNTAPSDSLAIFGQTFRDYRLDKIVLTNNTTIQKYTYNAYADTDSTVMFKMADDLPVGVYSYTVYVGNQFSSPGSTLTVLDKPSSSSAPFITSLDNTAYVIKDNSNNKIVIKGKNFKNGSNPVNVSFIPATSGSTVVLTGTVSSDGKRVALRLPDNFAAGTYFVKVTVNGVDSNQFSASIVLTVKS